MIDEAIGLFLRRHREENLLGLGTADFLVGPGAVPAGAPLYAKQTVTRYAGFVRGIDHERDERTVNENLDPAALDNVGDHAANLVASAMQAGMPTVTLNGKVTASAMPSDTPGSACGNDIRITAGTAM